MKKTLLCIVMIVCLLCTFVACQLPHVCTSKCDECGGCTNKDCQEAVCNNKCQGHDDPTDAFTVTFVTDSNVSVLVYNTQDMSGAGTATNTAYSRDSETGALLGDGEGQVNFKLVFASNYELAKIDIDNDEGYNNLKGSADTEVENGYRITKITANLTVTVTSQSVGTEEDLSQGYKVTFECDSHVSVRVYKTQDMSGAGEATDTAYSRESGTGTLTKTDGQVNFVLVFEEGYELASIVATPKDSYNNIKGPADTETENGYRITKITGEFTVTVTSQEEGAAEDLSQGFKITFVCDSGVTVTVYRTQEIANGEVTNTGYSRDSKLGTLLKDGTGQINFTIDCPEGYEVQISIDNKDGYNKCEQQKNGSYRITKISADLVVTITLVPTSAE